MYNTYAELFRYYQEIQIKLDKLAATQTTLFSFRQMLTQKEVMEVLSEVDISSIVRKIEKQDSYLKHKEYANLKREFSDLRFYLNAGNLRYVVSMHCKEYDLTTLEFPKKMNCSEEEMFDLLRNGIVSDDLLSAICKHFGIIKTSDFTRYIK